MVSANCYPVMGGVETHIHEVAPRLVEAGIDVTVLATDLTRALPVAEEVRGVKIRRVSAWPRNRDYYFAPQIYRDVRNGRWDVVHCQGYHTLVAPIGMVGAIRSRIPYVVTFHSGGHASAMRNRLRGVQRKLLRPLLARADRLIAVSRFERSLFQRGLRLPAELFTIIPNGANLPAIDHSGDPSDPERPLVLSVGRLERYKGHHRIIRAFPGVLRDVPGAQLRIAGVGPYANALESLIAQLSLGDHVEIRAVEPADRFGMAKLLTQARLVVLLSEYEANPVAVMEALGIGRPVLVADTSGLHDLAEDGLVTAVSLGSTAEDLAASIVKLLRDGQRASGVRLPTWDGCAQELLQVYRAAARA